MKSFCLCLFFCTLAQGFAPSVILQHHPATRVIGIGPRGGPSSSSHASYGSPSNLRVPTTSPSSLAFGLDDSTNMIVSHEVATEGVMGTVTENLIATSEFWSATIMFSIVGLLWAWEETVKSFRKALPETLMPVLDSMLAEMGGLGFIGLFLGVFVTGGLLGDVVEALSEEFLHDGEILLETFEFLHTTFFEVGIGFFLVTGLTVAKVLNKIVSLTEVATAAFDANGDGEVCLEELADALEVPTVPVDLDGDGDLSEEELGMALLKESSLCSTNYVAEATMGANSVRAEALVLRERFLSKMNLPDNFCMETYYGTVMSRNLEEMVELSPLTWLPLIPPISLARSVDMSRGIVSAASPNAALSCGFFLGTPIAVAANGFVFAVAVIWGLWNFWKMTAIKDMLLPTVVRDSKGGSKAILLPPRYEVDELYERFDSSPGIFGAIESVFGSKPARNRHESLFGKAGAAGPELYRESIKLQTWLVVSQIVFWGGQIVTRDFEALVRGSVTGYPDLVLPELFVYLAFVAIGVAQLWLVPQTFLNYSLCTSVESLAKYQFIYESCDDDGCRDVVSDRMLAVGLETQEKKKTSARAENGLEMAEASK